MPKLDSLNAAFGHFDDKLSHVFYAFSPNAVRLCSADPPMVLAVDFEWNDSDFPGDTQQTFQQNGLHVSVEIRFDDGIGDSHYNHLCVGEVASDEKSVAWLYHYGVRDDFLLENKLVIWSRPHLETQQEPVVLDVKACLRSRLSGSGISMDWRLVALSPSLVSCGSGRFLLEAAVLAGDEDTYTPIRDGETLLVRKLVMFSTEGIVWIGDSSLPGMDDLLPYHEDVALSSGCWDEEVRLIAASDQGIRLGTIATPGGTSTPDGLVSGWTRLPLPRVPKDSWKLFVGHSRIAICERQAIIALRCKSLNDTAPSKVLLCFYSFSVDNVCEIVKTIELVDPDNALEIYPVGVAPLGKSRVLVVTTSVPKGDESWWLGNSEGRKTARIFDLEDHYEIRPSHCMANSLQALQSVRRFVW